MIRVGAYETDRIGLTGQVFVAAVFDRNEIGVADVQDLSDVLQVFAECMRVAQRRRPTPVSLNSPCS